jgi:hypothetical protein
MNVRHSPVWDKKKLFLVFKSKTLQNSALVLKKTSYLCIYYFFLVVCKVFQIRIRIHVT